MSLHAVKRLYLSLLLVGALILSSLTGCKSSRGTVKRGGSGVSTTVYVPPFDVDKYSATLSDPVARALVKEAGGWLGTRYVYGGESKTGTDCSGLVMKVYGKVCGIKLPRTTREQVKYCTKVARNKILPGDLVFFARNGSDDDSEVSHVGLYIGDGRMIHASSSRGVMVSGFDTGYWGDRYYTAARVTPAIGKSVKPVKSAPDNPLPVEPIPGDIAPTDSSDKFDNLMPEPVIPPVSPDLPPVPGMPEIIPEVTLSANAATFGRDTVTSTIDLLDLIINQKVDSIFTSQFTD